MKVHSLLNSQNIMRVYDSSQVSSQSESQENTDHLQLKPSEIGALMTGIGNMLINLKKKLCEIILAWNARYFLLVATNNYRNSCKRSSCIIIHEFHFN